VGIFEQQMTTADDRTGLTGVDEARYSIVSAVYNVERYLDEFIASIEEQTIPLDRLEVVMVDDGSTDGSRDRLLRWQRERPELVRVLSKPNGGQGSARNLGLEHATGTWVAFTDPDDRLEPEYLQRVDAFVHDEPDVDLVATRLVVLDDETGQVTLTHPLRAMFRDGDVARRLNESIDFFAGSAPSAFFRRDRLVALGIRFDERVRPNFEDGHFTSRYLLASDDPVIGFVATARYLYRRRSDGSSTLQNSTADAGRYTNVLRYGYLDVLQLAIDKYGDAPGWLQSFVLYDLSWYFSSDERQGGAHAGRGAVADEFHALLRQIVERLDPAVIRDFRVRPLKREWRNILMHGYQSDDWHQENALVTRLDEHRGLVRLSYYFSGQQPDEIVRVRGRRVTPYSSKVRDVVSHDRVVLHERILWVTSKAPIRLRLNGRDVAIDVREPEPSRRTLFPSAMQREAQRRRGVEPAPELEPEQQRLLKWAASRAVRKVFGNAWVLMDRVHDADDSGEHLFRHLRRNHRDINAWFVIEKDTPDWRRLKKDGNRRIVPFGSLRWKLLMLNCRHLVSSHADEAIVRPPALSFIKPTWRFTFLQHGVIKDDLSTWLNAKPIEVFVTSTPAEFGSVAGDHTTYTFTPKETVLTGLPRFDLLRRAGEEVGPDQRDLVLVAPTWRNWLLPALLPGSQRRPDFGPELLESEFLDRWLKVLASPEVKEACRQHGRTLAFLPHPNLHQALDSIELPDHVESLTFVDNDVRSLFARGALLVTDYSSMAFNSAYIDRPVLYYQFDRERVQAGDHVGRTGYFDYERDGFGPVVTTHEDVVAGIVAALEHGPVPTPEYLERIAETFPQRDGRCCERVTKAILDADRPLTVKQAASPPQRAKNLLTTRSEALPSSVQV
jgi:glycosyltransferase involved in cell wall biosynthesis